MKNMEDFFERTCKKMADNGIVFCGMLFIVFLVLKLTKFIAWSWWWVSAPLWIPVALVLAILAIILVVWLIIALFQAIF